jgi:hypothetical protein
MKTYGGVDVQIHVFLTSVLVGEWSASRTGRFTPRGKSPGTHWIGGWVDHRAGLDDVEKRKFLTLPGLELDTSVVQPVASRHTDCPIPAVLKADRPKKVKLVKSLLVFCIHVRASH